MATIKDIAKLLDISVSAVSMALNDSPEIGEKTKIKVREAAKQLNYVRNGSAIDLQRKKTNVVLLITDNPTRPYFTDSLTVVQNELMMKNIDLVIITANDKHRGTAERFISENRADAVICMSKFISDEFVNLYANKSMPIFVMGRAPELIANEYAVNVALDYERVGEDITEYLIAKGHRKIAFVKGSKTSVGTSYRYKGYLRTLKRFQLTLDKELIFEARGSDYDHGYGITEKIIGKIASGQADAIFYATDDLAVGGLQKLLENGIAVPEDVSIVGYNNYPISRMVTPPITTVDLHQQKIMRRVAKSLIAMVEGSKTKADVVKKLQKDAIFQSEIIERGSVKNRE
ncbi:LacI family DNA-binding transcriptional regulator [Paenibacillus macerans]|uniref:LacI family DNA-binding transcriptional regulator n=1 Tax=Paenibacillus macerans TaxID=44252 RepID=A0A6N8ETQ2_PAEMA|nr:LacI family DNA-binding transcriptional regulator [Paenibacillus macerans]MUG23035.1 LacI family DNA-binding transcriptional regulator [Paenibacillus macerans]UMV47105.1 LacI family transcriptional regulator [Paenibacillus macerans]